MVKLEDIDVITSNISSTAKLNFDETIISIPTIEEAYQLRLTRPKLDMLELADNFQSDSERFLGYSFDSNMMEFQYYNSQNQNNNRIRIKDDPQYNLEFNQLSYYDKNTKDDIFFMPYPMIYCATKGELYDKDIDLGSIYKLDFLNKDSSDFIFAEEVLDEMEKNFSYFFNSTEFDLKPYCYQKKDDLYYFVYQMNYHGLPINTDYFNSINEEGNPDYSADSGVFAEAVVDVKKNVYRIVSIANLNVEKIEQYTELLSPIAACNLIENEISDDVVFNVSRFDLVYNYKQVFTNDEKTDFYWECNPYWKVTVYNTGIPNYPKLAFWVNAINSEVTTYLIV